MMKALFVLSGVAALAACSTVSDLLPGTTELAAVASVAAPLALAETNYPAATVEHGRYLVGLLGCGNCHSNGALLGAPVAGQALAGSDTGIAWTNPQVERAPGIVYPSNLTPDVETGLGTWTLNDLVAMLRSGLERHSGQLLPVLPWPDYANLQPNDANAIAAYLLSLPPVRHQVPATVQPGQRSNEPYVYFGVYMQN